MPFLDAGSAISGTLQAWLPQFVKSDRALEESLVLLRDLHIARQVVGEDVVLKMVEDALTKAHRTREGYGSTKGTDGRTMWPQRSTAVPSSPSCEERMKHGCSSEILQAAANESTALDANRYSW
jgi:hypothetical protein